MVGATAVRLEARTTQPFWLVLMAPVVAIVAALLLAGILIAASGVSMIDAFQQTLIGAFGTRLGLAETLTRATPLILTGLAAAVAFRARLWNIGAEGQLYIGALAVAATAAATSELPGYFLIPMLAVAGVLGGMVLLLLPLLLRLRFGVDEVVTTLLLNFIAILFVSMMIEGPLKDPLAFGWPQSAPVPTSAELPRLLERTRLHVGLVMAVLLALLVHWLQSRSLFGLQSRASGLNPTAAVFAGVPLDTTLVKVACLSGGLAGLAGAVEVLGVKGYVTTDLSPGFGYAGIMVAMLAALHPIGVVGAALFAATLYVGADGMSRAVGIPSFIADVTVALSLLTMLVALFFTRYRIRL